MFINTTVILKIICQLLNCVSCNLLWRNTFTIEKETRYILLPLILNYRFLDKPSVAMEIAGSNLKQMKGSMGKGKGESLWPLTSHLPHTFYTGVYKILFNLQYWLVSFPSVLYAGEYVLSSVYWVLQTLQLPWVTKTEFLLTISIQDQPDKWRELRKISIWGKLVDPILNSLC